MSEEISKKLDELHDHLDSVDGDDAADLQAAVRKYQSNIESDEEDHDFVDGLRDAALRYEVTHPELSNFMARIINSLTAAGF